MESRAWPSVSEYDERPGMQAPLPKAEIELDDGRTVSLQVWEGGAVHCPALDATPPLPCPA